MKKKKNKQGRIRQKEARSKLILIHVLAIHIIFNKFGEDLKKSEHFALVLANRNITKCAGMILGSTDRLAYYVTKDKVCPKGERERRRRKGKGNKTQEERKRRVEGE